MALTRTTTIRCDGPSTSDCETVAPVQVVTGVKDGKSAHAAHEVRRRARQHGWVHWRFQTGPFHDFETGLDSYYAEWRDYCGPCSYYWREHRA
ncbi:MAG: hypothetical protein GY906_10075 [bacterium]|nr:hypothetical protein [bacterium]